MRLPIITSIAFLCVATSVLADQPSPIFGSSTQAPVMIAVNPETGLPMASADLPKPVVASVQ
jgi:hypothetical protein